MTAYDSNGSNLGHSGGSSGPALGDYFKAAGGVFDAIGGVANDLFAMQGAKAEASTYEQAASISGENADLTKASTKIKQVAAQREMERTLGQQRATEASQGFSTFSGSSYDLLQYSAGQGALANQLIGMQGQISYNGYKLQQNAYLGEAAAAKRAESGAMMGILGNVVKGAMAVAPLLLL